MKTIIITGATGGLGSEVTKHFLDSGYNVIATTTSEKKKSALPDHPNLSAEVIDLTDHLLTQHWVSQCIAKYQKIDAALLLAGGFSMGDLKSTTGDDLNIQIDLNFKTAYNILKPLWPHMIANEFGRIILVGSRVALEPNRASKMIAYSLSKSLLIQLSEYLNTTSETVKSIVLVPDTIDTPANRQSMPGADQSKWHSPAQIFHTIDSVLNDPNPTETVIKLY